MGGRGRAWGIAGLAQPELTIEEARLGSGVALGVAIPSPAQLLAVEEVPEPGAGVQAVPVGRMCAQPHCCLCSPARGAGPMAPLPWPSLESVQLYHLCAPTACPAQDMRGNEIDTP